MHRLDESHLETPDREVKGPEAAALATKFSSAAKAWWQSMVAEPHSFNKPTYYLGLGDTVASNVLVAGAHERTQHNVKLLAMGASGFSNPGDKACFKIKVRVRPITHRLHFKCVPFSDCWTMSSAICVCAYVHATWVCVLMLYKWRNTHCQS